jgi:hypothetical protein
MPGGNELASLIEPPSDGFVVKRSQVFAGKKLLSRLRGHENEAPTGASGNTIGDLTNLFWVHSVWRTLHFDNDMFIVFCRDHVGSRASQELGKCRTPGLDDDVVTTLPEVGCDGLKSVPLRVLLRKYHG